MYLFSPAPLLVTHLSNLLEVCARCLSPSGTALAHQGCWSCTAPALPFSGLSPALTQSTRR